MSIHDLPWRDRLLQAKEGRLDLDDIRQLAIDADEFSTCAIAEHRSALERVGHTFDREYGYPTSKRLDTLGMRFYHRIRDRDWGGALSTLDEIVAETY